ncbi:hypothetical protein ACIQPT_24800 [Streptomyces sp. NPDC091289]|uniref:hypothetical protein n=1 Tax=Streptomyces sp. NPDC091289 TaxID=3365989 RepID=UPI0037F6F982
MRRVLALRLGTTTRAELDDAVVCLRGRVAAFTGGLSAGVEDMNGADRGFLLEVAHLLDNPPAPQALSHEVYSHVRALARVLRKLAAMNRADVAGLAVSPRLPLPVRPVPGRGTGR